MNNTFYNTDSISGLMSLRKPQTEALKILENILNNIELKKNLEDLELKQKLEIIKNLYPICTDFERKFISLSFSLATGVGKTRLMGAFIAYLYTQKNIKNFFIVAPNTTIYDKLKRELSDINNPKYVFNGVLSCFNKTPQIIKDDDYKNKPLPIFNSDIRIFIYNIDKFKKVDAKMKEVNEIIGDSFYNYLANLSDLVVIMDESHHYRAEKGLEALDNLKPLLGLELTATPLFNNKNKQEKFKNVVYEYPLSQAIADGYTRTPYALTRQDIEFYNFGDEELDKLMLNDGVLCHERIKQKLELYAAENNLAKIKPFMLVVCKDTNHASNIETYIRCNEFQEGKYKNKTLLIHSKQKKADKDANIKMLLEVEKAENMVEIVIHCDILKEGWDVNNLYTIVPLRVASSKILREQMVGRGLRLPYGKRTGDKEVDAVILTAHDKFKEILEEAEKGTSIFKAGNIIKAEEIKTEKIKITQLSFEDLNKHEEDYQETGLDKNKTNEEILATTKQIIQEEVAKSIQKGEELTETKKAEIVEKIEDEISKKEDLAINYHKNEMPLKTWIYKKSEKIHIETKKKFIPIPRLKITETGIAEYSFKDFDLNLEFFNHSPIENNILLVSLQDKGDYQFIVGNAIDFEAINPAKEILSFLRLKPEINYEKCAELLFKLIKQALNHYETKYNNNGMRNIVMMYKKTIAELIYKQMMQNFSHKEGLFVEEIIGVSSHNFIQTHNYKEKANLYDNFSGDIRSILFTGIKKGVFDTAKFDSKEGELFLARILEQDPYVLNWLRPSKQEFEIYYSNNRRYEPDFVVETEQIIYLVEVKGDDKLEDAEVIAKKEKAVKYCKLATEWARANNYKEWKYLFIPASEIKANSSFKNLALKFVVSEE